MRTLYFIILIIFCIVGLFGQERQDTSQLHFNHFLSQQTKNNYQLGETFEYVVRYGFLGLGEAKISIDTAIYFINDRPTYKIDLTARTKNIVRLFAKIDELIGSYTDTQTFQTLKSFKYVKESDYTRDEVVYYEPQKSRAKVYAMTRNQTVFDTGTFFSLLPNSYDVTTALMNLRSQNLSQLKKGDKITINCFFENVNYFSTLYFEKKEVLRTSLGKLHTLVFKGATQKTNFLKDVDEPVHTIWISDDDNHIILRIESETVYGNVKIVLDEAYNLKYPLTSKYRKKKDY